MVKPAVLLFLLCSMHAAARADETAAAYVGAPDCRIAVPGKETMNEAVWDGACKDGYADGKGVLRWRDEGKRKVQMEATLVRGQAEGDAKLKRDDGMEFIGQMEHGIPHGKGYYMEPGGLQYEGGVVHGQREGVAEVLYPHGDHYQGEWKGGRPNGLGRMEYALGGQYEGQWKAGRRHGHGVLTYAGSGRRFEGEFVAGLIAGQAPRVRSKVTYDLMNDEPRTGTHLHEALMKDSAVPPKATYEQLTQEEKQVIADYYPALEEGDEPPYPLSGPAEFYRFLAKVAGRMSVRGDVVVYALVGADGSAQSVTVQGSVDQEVRRVIGSAAGLVKYKPALCHGQPCAMIFPYRMRLHVKY